MHYERMPCMPEHCTHRCFCPASAGLDHLHPDGFDCSVTQRWFTHQPGSRDGIAGARYVAAHPEGGICLATCVVPVVDGEVWGLWRANTCPAIPVTVLACLAGWIETLMATAAAEEEA